MIRTALASTALVATLLAPATARAQATAADAAPFLGDWTLALQGPNGPATFNLSVKVENDKVVGEIASEAIPTQKIESSSKTDTSFVLNYSFPWEGNSIGAVITLTPGTDGKVAAQMDFAGGAYTMTGTATRKEKEK
jgi:hypothetical protein